MKNLEVKSSVITGGDNQAPNRGMLRTVGFQEDAITDR